MTTGATQTTIDPTATLHPSATLGVGVTIGAGVIIGPGCVVGDRTSLAPRAILVRNTTLGSDNRIHANAVLGDDPQDRAFDPDADPGSLAIGDDNIIREFVTIHRGAGDAGPTRIGSGCFLMVSSHVGHNCVVGDRVILTNYAGLAGHVHLGDGAILSGHAAVHQFCDAGELCMFQAGARVSQHVPPYTIVHRDGNRLAGINTVGLRRAGYSAADITQIRDLYKMLFRTGRPMPVMLDEARHRDWRPAAMRLLDFCDAALARTPPRAHGLCRATPRVDKPRSA